MEKTVRRAPCGHGTSPKGRCEGSPEPSEVSSLGKLSVFLISYNLINRIDINTDLEIPTVLWDAFLEFLGLQFSEILLK
jgi:hypothetical protein